MNRQSCKQVWEGPGPSFHSSKEEEAEIDKTQRVLDKDDGVSSDGTNSGEHFRMNKFIVEIGLPY